LHFYKALHLFSIFLLISFVKVFRDDFLQL
jgi:hypothetical protein